MEKTAENMNVRQRLLIKGGKVLVGRDWQDVDVYVEEGVIVKIGKDINLGEIFDETKICSDDLVEIVDGRGRWISPGFVDVHVHLREPGFEHKETIESGTLAAAKGGYTTIFSMANLNPCPDTYEKMKDYMNLLKQKALINVIPYSPITAGEKGKSLVDMEEMLSLGISNFSDDGVGVADAMMMRAAMERAAELSDKTSTEKRLMIVAHTEDMMYRKENASIHEGKRSKELGLVGIPSICESSQLQRDLSFALETQVSYHACHLSAKESVELLRQAKEKGADVSGEVTPHHLLLVDEQVVDPNWKMNPPLRTKEDRMALIKGLKDGTIDLIATDHAPHSEEEKNLEMEHAPFGVVGLETAFAVLYTSLVRQEGILTIEELISCMAEKPAARFGLRDRGIIKEGKTADIVILNLDKMWTIDKSQFASKGKNTPFEGEVVWGAIEATFVRGRKVY